MRPHILVIRLHANILHWWMGPGKILSECISSAKLWSNIWILDLLCKSSQALGHQRRNYFQKDRIQDVLPQTQTSSKVAAQTLSVAELNRSPSRMKISVSAINSLTKVKALCSSCPRGVSGGSFSIDLSQSHNNKPSYLTDELELNYLSLLHKGHAPQTKWAQQSVQQV